VVKECKASYTWKATDWDETVKITEKAKELANEFNTQVRRRHSNGQRKSINSTMAFLVQVLILITSLNKHDTCRSLCSPGTS